MENIHLIGAETVASAARTIRGAADRMDQAVTNLDGALDRHQRFMDDWLQRFQAALNEHADRLTAPLVTIDPTPLDLQAMVDEVMAKNPAPVICKKTSDCGLWDGHPGECNHDFMPF